MPCTCLLGASCSWRSPASDLGFAGRACGASSTNLGKFEDTIAKSSGETSDRASWSFCCDLKHNTKHHRMFHRSLIDKEQQPDSQKNSLLYILFRSWYVVVNVHQHLQLFRQPACENSHVELFTWNTVADTAFTNTHLFRLPSFSKTSLSSSFICATRSDASSFFRFNSAWMTANLIGKTDTSNKSTVIFYPTKARTQSYGGRWKQAAFFFSLHVRQEAVPVGYFGAPSVWSHPSATSFSEKTKGRSSVSLVRQFFLQF